MLLSDGYIVQLVNFHEFPASAYANVVSPAGDNMYLPSSAWTLTGGKPWTSPDGMVFNTTHRFVAPDYGLDVTVATLQPDNIVRFLLQPVFYEGASQITGTHRGQAVTGDAFTERLIYKK